MCIRDSRITFAYSGAIPINRPLNRPSVLSTPPGTDDTGPSDLRTFRPSDPWTLGPLDPWTLGPSSLTFHRSQSLWPQHRIGQADRPNRLLLRPEPRERRRAARGLVAHGYGVPAVHLDRGGHLGAQDGVGPRRIETGHAGHEILPCGYVERHAIGGHHPQC